MSYPSFWKREEDSAERAALAIRFITQNEPVFCRIGILKIRPGISLKEVWDSAMDHNFINQSKIIESKFINLDNNPAKKIIYINNNGCWTDILTINKDLAYIISFLSFMDPSEYQSTIGKMIDSLKIIK
jgi:hypothetical protein